MKNFLGIGYNFFKTIKSSDKDTNKEIVYAEANFILSEAKYEVTNSGNISKSREVSEVEVLLDLKSAIEVRNSMDEIIEILKKHEDGTK